MTPRRSRRAALLLAGLLVAGCARSSPAEVGNEHGIDPAAPVAAGHAALPLPGEPTPLVGRALSGLYASPPSADTLAALSTAPVSPDGLFRAALADGALWVTRIDGAWLWQVALPPPGTPSPADAGTGPGPAAGQAAAQPAGTAQGQAPGNQAGTRAGGASGADSGAQAGQAEAGAPEPGDPGGGDVRPVAPIQWTPRSTLLFRDTLGRWLEADPLTATVTPLSAFLTGAVNLTPSPDGSQVLFSKGNRLYVARWDGSEPQLVGENVEAYWDESGQLVVTRRPPETANPNGPAPTP